MLKPHKLQVYLIYKCPGCGSESDMLRLREAQSLSSIECPFCERQETICPIKSVMIEYGDSKANEKTSSAYSEAINILNQYSDDPQSLIDRVIQRDGHQDTKELIRKSLALIKDE